MDLETKIKQKLLDRGFSNKTLLNNRGLIGSTIDECRLEIDSIIDTFKDLPTECIHDCSDTKFCESRLYNQNCCKECFRNND